MSLIREIERAGLIRETAKRLGLGDNVMVQLNSPLYRLVVDLFGQYIWPVFTLVLILLLLLHFLKWKQGIKKGW